MTPYDVTKLGHHQFRWWLVAWRHQAITWTYLLTNNKPRQNINHEKINLKITLWKLPHLPAVNELKFFYCHKDSVANQSTKHKSPVCISPWFPDCERYKSVFVTARSELKQTSLQEWEDKIGSWCVSLWPFRWPSAGLRTTTANVSNQ